MPGGKIERLDWKINIYLEVVLKLDLLWSWNVIHKSLVEVYLVESRRIQISYVSLKKRFQQRRLNLDNRKTEANYRNVDTRLTQDLPHYTRPFKLLRKCTATFSVNNNVINQKTQIKQTFGITIYIYICVCLKELL